MAEHDAEQSLVAECLAAMAASGEAYPCDLLAPLAWTGGAVPEPSPAARVTGPLRPNQRG